MAGCLPLSLETGGNMGQCARVETGRPGRPTDIPQFPILGLLRVYPGHWKLWGAPLQETRSGSQRHRGTEGPHHDCHVSAT